jgi:protein-S-isoprenylcysteine O-methyltransferase Ste14
MKEKMSRWGIGPIFAFLSIGYGMMTLVISRYFHPFFQIDFVPTWLLSILGIALIVIGVPFFLLSAKVVTRAYNADELVTDGIFRCCKQLDRADNTDIYVFHIIYIGKKRGNIFGACIWFRIS